MRGLFDLCFRRSGELKFNLDWRRIVDAFEFVLLAVGGIVHHCPQSVLVRQFVGLNEGLLYQFGSLAARAFIYFIPRLKPIRVW